MWKKEQIEKNLFHGEWVKAVRKTKSRIVVEISIRKRISTESGDMILDLYQDRKYVKPENLYPEHTINWLKFDRSQQN